MDSWYASKGPSREWTSFVASRTLEDRRRDDEAAMAHLAQRSRVCVWVCAALSSMLDFLGGAFFLFLGVQLVDESVEVLSGNWFKGVFGMLIGALVVVLAAVPILSALAGARISNEIESWERTRRSIGEKVDR